MYERREYLHNVQGMETRAELRAVWTTRYPASYYLTGLLVHAIEVRRIPTSVRSIVGYEVFQFLI